MVQQVIRYQASDGSEHISHQSASARERWIERSAEALLPLGRREELKSNQCIQHRAEAVLQAKRNLIALTREVIPQWFTDVEKQHGPQDWDGCHPSWFGWMLDGSCPPLEKAWWRFSCINKDSNREYEQPYYAEHPVEAQATPINVAISGGIMEIKQCPFCGSSDCHVESQVDGCGHEPYVNCADCGADGPWGDDESEAVRLWNSRSVRTNDADAAEA